MTLFVAPSPDPVVTSRARVIAEAHRLLLALVQELRFDLSGVSQAALEWLEERGLVEVLMGDDDLEYEVTARGRQAVLGRPLN